MRITLTVIALCVTVSGASAPAFAQGFGGAGSPDLILVNGKVITVDEKFTIAQAVAVQGDRIAAVGTNDEIEALAGTTTTRIDLRGRTVIPGLIDNHMHLFRAAATWPLEVRLEGVTTRKQAIDMIRVRAKSVGSGQWIFTIGGWATAQFLDNPRPFTRAELDLIAPQNPLALQESYYQVFLNSRALKEFGIEAGMPDPPDFVKGTIQRDAMGRPTGIIRGDIAATRPVQARLPKVGAGGLEASATQLLRDMNRAGLTSFGVVGCTDDVLRLLRGWRDQGRLNVRAFCIDGAAAGAPEDVDRSIEQIHAMKLFQGDNYIDSVFFGESVYGPLHDPMFAITSSPEAAQLAAWRRIATAIAEAGLPLHVHANLTTTIDAFLDQIEAINAEHPIRNLRWTLAHLNQVTAPELDRMKRLGLYAAVHPWGVINGAIMHTLFGDGAGDLSPFAAIQASGIPWGFGSDGTAANQYLPFTALQFAVTGKLGGRKVITQTIGREDALIAYTRKNAYFVFREDALGAIQVGKLADLVVLDRDYLTVPEDQIKDIKPLVTLVGGRIVYNAVPDR